jgi:hypothetical protein
MDLRVGQDVGVGRLHRVTERVTSIYVVNQYSMHRVRYTLVIPSVHVSRRASSSRLSVPYRLLVCLVGERWVMCCVCTCTTVSLIRDDTPRSAIVFAVEPLYIETPWNALSLSLRPSLNESF